MRSSLSREERNGQREPRRHPAVRSHDNRFRLGTPILRVFNQQIHGSKRSLCSVEDFPEFEPRTAYFNDDQISPTRKGVNLPDRSNQVATMAQMQNIIDFASAPKLEYFRLPLRDGYHLYPHCAWVHLLDGRAGLVHSPLLAWRMSITLEADFCIEAVEEALVHGTPEIFNTD